MTDHKFTDEEIIKALELCFSEKGTTKTCRICPYHKLTLCKIYCDKDALYLIKRQKAEIERLTTLAKLGKMRTNDYRSMRDKAKTARAEAIKEFAERLCDGRVSNDPVVIAARCLLKEMTEGKDHENISD